ncbi:hypothetical protein Tco_0769890 [Tanacetum coccineum]|uniref:Uncharacterized protein n=1 Tax=Tanacetum coccineum TaxID=301880 RepID=A0ABQ4ZAN0_9ASTR
MKRSTNKFADFEMYDVNEQNELRELKNMEIMDEFLNKLIDPSENDMRDWDLDMIAYFKKKKELLVDKVMRVLALGWHLEEIHMTWAHLEKKWTRLRLYTKNHEELYIQRVETASPSLSDDVRIFIVMASEI